MKRMEDSKTMSGGVDKIHNKKRRYSDFYNDNGKCRLGDPWLVASDNISGSHWIAVYIKPKDDSHWM